MAGITVMSLLMILRRSWAIGALLLALIVLVAYSRRSPLQTAPA